MYDSCTIHVPNKYQTNITYIPNINKTYTKQLHNIYQLNTKCMNQDPIYINEQPYFKFND